MHDPVDAYPVDTTNTDAEITIPAEADGPPEVLRTGARLLNDTFEVVDQEFRYVPMRDDRVLPDGSYRERDEYPTPRQNTRATPETTDRALAPGVERRSSFTPQQNEYIKVAISTLVKLASGRDQESQDQRYPTLTERITRHYLATDDPTGRWRSSLETSVTEIMAQFGELYPNLLPAMDAMFAVAAANGTDTALNIAGDCLQDALKYGDDISRWPKGVQRILGYMEQEVDRLEQAAQRMRLAATRFTGLHPRYGDQIVEHEVHCSGMTVAIDIIRSSATAAIQIAHMQQDGEIAVPYDNNVDGFSAPFPNGDYETVLKQHIHAMTEAARARHSPVGD